VVGDRFWCEAGADLVGDVAVDQLGLLLELLKGIDPK
jgi:hypothetical protein